MGVYSGKLINNSPIPAFPPAVDKYWGSIHRGAHVTQILSIAGLVITLMNY